MTLTVVCGDEDSCVIVIMDIRRLTVQRGRSVDSSSDWVHTQPACWVSQNSIPERKLIKYVRSFDNISTRVSIKICFQRNCLKSLILLYVFRFQASYWVMTSLPQCQADTHLNTPYLSSAAFDYFYFLRFEPNILNKWAQWPTNYYMKSKRHYLLVPFVFKKKSSCYLWHHRWGYSYNNNNRSVSSFFIKMSLDYAA